MRKRLTAVILALGVMCLCAPALCEEEPDEISIALIDEDISAPDPDGDGEPSGQVYAVSDVSSELTETPVIEGERPEFVSLLLDVARGELGYTEGRDNYSKYGEWAGDANAAWCAEFICWCVNRVDKLHGTSLLNNVYPNYSGQNTGRDWFVKRGRMAYRKGSCPEWGYQWIKGADERMGKNGYVPRAGDLVFFSYNEAGDTEHVALVEYSARNSEGNIVVHVIEGNNPDSVSRNSYMLDNSQILGFGVCEDVIGTTMRVGNQGDKVLELQKALNELGLLGERHMTGGFGSNTKRAVMTFQSDWMADKEPTGIADRDTQQAIESALYEYIYNSPDSWLVDE